MQAFQFMIPVKRLNGHVRADSCKASQAADQNTEVTADEHQALSVYQQELDYKVSSETQDGHIQSLQCLKEQAIIQKVVDAVAEVGVQRKSEADEQIGAVEIPCYSSMLG